MKELSNFKKIEGLKNLEKYSLPAPATIFILDFKKQEKEIDDFLKNRDIVMIRSDKEVDMSFCLHNLNCPKAKAKKFIEKLVSEGYAAILQEHVPSEEDKLSGNILIFKKNILMELMEGGPLTLLNREGKLDEYIKIRRNDFKETEHFGKRLITKEDLGRVLKLIKKVPPFKILEFSIGQDWLYFWQIRDDKTAKELKD